MIEGSSIFLPSLADLLVDAITCINIGSKNKLCRQKSPLGIYRSAHSIMSPETSTGDLLTSSFFKVGLLSQGVGLFGGGKRNQAKLERANGL